MASQTLPDSVIIVGAGIFGLSTALAIARRYPDPKVTVIDRQTPPVEDGTSVDTTRCIRSVYADPDYGRLAAKAQRMIEADPELKPHYFKQGMSFITSGRPGPLLEVWKKGLAHLESQGKGGSVVHMKTPEEVFQRVHGKGAEPAPDSKLSKERSWNYGYCNLEDAFIDAKESIRVCYERCLEQPSITFRCGVPVHRISIQNGRATGVVLENGEVLAAGLTLVAAGAWSPRLVDLEGMIASSAIEVAWIKLTDEEVAKWKNMSITTNLNTGLNLFPPHKGETKILRRSPGYKNTVTVPHPEDPSKTLQTSIPRTTVSNPTDVIPFEAEVGLRDQLREIMPSLADRPFDRTKLCWLSHTSSSDFIIAPHPRIQGLHVATGGSGHAWKFLPIIGDLVLDSVHDKLPKNLKDKWAYAPKGADMGNASMLRGEIKELRDYVRSSDDGVRSRL
ncbi:uncharacterized protein E0L32_011597 [Thyridium curvatum]|uniref:FAD dependent oxidoreductase domain-containing protein n=1 Tax=Thyridium curvatum TaxID=1093900 RepID=A0A507BI96_9PEZI|nr:uncharacterized protein E0L32_011597 [Thyridium curvatum]TPX18484.1 hypothetical protein E0L32_011597 [Thyridium curvatum]